MCHGLGAAHETGVGHRDIKPQNMLILPETGELKIMDFGISRVSSVEPGSSGLTTAGTVMGTPDYMPPEQAQGRPADFRSDLYSLAVVLFEIFTGQLPFKGDTPMAVVVAHIQQPAPKPRSVNPKLSPELEAHAPPEARGLSRDQVRLMVSTLHDKRITHTLCQPPGKWFCSTVVGITGQGLRGSWVLLLRNKLSISSNLRLP